MIWLWTGLGVLIIAGGIVLLLRLVVPRVVFHSYTHPMRLKNHQRPDMLGLQYEHHDFTYNGIEHKGWIIFPPDGSGNGPMPAVIMPHGYAANRSDILERCATVARAGYCVYSFDWCAHGESGGTICSAIFEEHKVLLHVLQLVRSLPMADKQRIALYGFSMGAANAIIAAERDGNVRCTVADSPFAELRGVMESIFRRLRLPVSIIGQPVRRLFERQFKCSIDSLLVTDSIARLPARQVLLLGGTHDKLVPHEHLLALHEARGNEGPIHITENGGHFDNASEDVMDEVILPFLAEHMQPDS